MHTRLKSLIIPALALFCFTVLSCLWLSRLGLAVDEATHGFWAQQTLLNIKRLLGAPDLIFKTVSDEFPPEFFLLPVGSAVFPLMTCFFTGTFIIYWLVPVVFFFGQSILALRLAFIPFGIVFLVSVYYVCRRFFGALVANVAIVLLAFNSVLIRSMRVGAEREEIVVSALCWAGFALFLSSDSGKRQLLKIAFAGLLWGFALWAKISFVAYACGLVLAIVLLRKIVWRQVCSRFLSVGNVVVLIAGFVCGALPFIVYNALTSCEAFFASVACVFSPAADRSLSYIDALALRYGHVLRLLSANLANCSIDSGRVLSGAPAAIFAFIVVLLYVCFFRAENFFSRPVIVGIMIVYAMLFCFSAFTPSEFEPEHVISFLPFFEIMMALAIAVLIRVARGVKKIPALALACFIGIAPVAEHSLVVAKYFAALKAGEGYLQYFPGQHEMREIIRGQRLFPIAFIDSYSLGVNIEYGLLNGLGKEDFNRNIKSFYLLVENTGKKTAALEMLELVKSDPNIVCQRVYALQSAAQDYELAVYALTPAGQADYNWVCMFDKRYAWHWAPLMLKDCRTPLFHVGRLLDYEVTENDSGKIVFTPVSR